ncbi:MAG: hypothetical protein A2Z20_10935 [Bdellovibrionales bacterium RBG_16_40_8]|nr:MAG: hypothetical protein A2Z20_10935 [Bdellovibrionales bacterium RBG_16_40_8]
MTLSLKNHNYVLNTRLGTNNDPQKFDEFRRAVRTISRKLGGLRAQEILQDLDFSQKEFEANRSFESNRTWIRKLLLWYYDPLYKCEYKMGIQPCNNVKS